jgi:hypothetical protein
MPAGVFKRGNRSIGRTPKHYSPVTDRSCQRLARSNLMTPCRDVPSIERKSKNLFHDLTPQFMCFLPRHPGVATACFKRAGRGRIARRGHVRRPCATRITRSPRRRVVALPSPRLRITPTGLCNYASKAGNSDRRNRGRRSFCAPRGLHRRCRLRVICRHRRALEPCLLYPQSGLRVYEHTP